MLDVGCAKTSCWPRTEDKLVGPWQSMVEGVPWAYKTGTSNPREAVVGERAWIVFPEKITSKLSLEGSIGVSGKMHVLRKKKTKPRALHV